VERRGKNPLNKKDRTRPQETVPTSPEGQSQEQKLQTMLTALWERSRHTVMERAALLENAGALLKENRMDDATQQRAVDSAHKLAGVLGTFGLPRGTDLAREAEGLFGKSTPPSKLEIERLQILLAELTSLIARGPSGQR
jgi:HPt (histidine-containing phosphotransfer) domain-containing protein